MTASMSTANAAEGVATTSISSMEKNDDRPWKVVTHIYPDTDAFACLWAALKFIIKDDEHEVVFVRAGEGLLPEEALGYRVLHMDTGKGDLDQHGKGLKRASSFQLLCEKYGLTDDPGIKPILELTRATDNVEAVPLTSVHYVLKGLAYRYRDPKTKEVNWQTVLSIAVILFDILYDQGVQRARSREQLAILSRRYTLRNNFVLATIWWNPHLANAAYESGADVVMWTQNIDRKAGKFYVGIQCNRNSSVTLESVIAGIRLAEAKKRGVDARGHDLRSLAPDPAFGGWFIHDSLKLIACGTRGHPLKEGEFTQLSPQEILDVLTERMSQFIRKATR